MQGYASCAISVGKGCAPLAPKGLHSVQTVASVHPNFYLDSGPSPGPAELPQVPVCLWHKKKTQVKDVMDVIKEPT